MSNENPEIYLNHPSRSKFASLGEGISNIDQYFYESCKDIWGGIDTDITLSSSSGAAENSKIEEDDLFAALSPKFPNSFYPDIKDISQYSNVELLTEKGNYQFCGEDVCLDDFALMAPRTFASDDHAGIKNEHYELPVNFGGNKWNVSKRSSDFAPVSSEFSGSSGDRSETTRTSLSSIQEEDLKSFGHSSSLTKTTLSDELKSATLKVEEVKLVKEEQKDLSLQKEDKVLQMDKSPKVQRGKTDDRGRSLGAEYDPFYESELNRTVDINSCNETPTFTTDYPSSKKESNNDSDETECPKEVLNVVKSIHELVHRQHTLLRTYLMTDSDWKCLDNLAKKSQRRKAGDSIKWVADYNSSPYLKGRKNRVQKYILRKNKVNSLFGVLNMRGIRAWVRCSYESDNEDDIDDG